MPIFTGMATHIPQLATITDFYKQLRIGLPQGDDLAIMRIEDQPPTKRMEMPLFRCNFYRIVFFTNEGVDFQLAEEQLQISSHSIYFAYPGKLESWRTSQKIYGYLVCFTADFAQIDALHASFDHQFPFFNFNGQSLLRCSPETTLPLQQTLERMLEEQSNSFSDRADMLRFLLRQYLIQVRRLYQTNQDQQSPESKNGQVIFNRFKLAADTYFLALAKGEAREQISVSLIANELHLHPSYLNTVIKNLTGQTASSFLHHQVVLEAKSYLMHTDFQVAEIAFRLGFSNDSYFTRFFKRLTQQTPLAFRKAQR